jgi:hypothetical protein
VHRNNFGTSTLSGAFKRLMTRLAPYAAAASAALILWHAARDIPTSVVFVPAPLLADLSPPQTVPSAAAGPLATEPLASSVFSRSAILNDSSSSFRDDRARISIN